MFYTYPLLIWGQSMPENGKSCTWGLYLSRPIHIYVKIVPASRTEFSNPLLFMQILYWIFSTYYGNTIQQESFVHKIINKQISQGGAMKAVIDLILGVNVSSVSLWIMIFYFRHLILSIFLYSKLPIPPFTHPACICNLVWYHHQPMNFTNT